MRKFKRASDIKVGVVGYGGAFNMGKKHLDEMKQAGMTPVAVAEIDASRLKVAKDDFPGIQTYSSLGAMLKRSDVNLIAIITPHNTHAPLALQALRSGCSVCCEKPLAITTAECDAMINTAKKKNAVITTYHNRHWDGCILQAVKSVVEKKLIGEVYKITCFQGRWGRPKDWWRTNKKIAGGISYDWGVHILEYSLQLIQDRIQEVTGFNRRGFWADKVKWGKETYEDESFITVRFKSGKWLTLTNTHLDSNPDHPFVEVTGTRGTYFMNHTDYEIITHNRKGETIRTSGSNPDGEQWRFYQNLADHMVKGEKLIITGEWSRRPIHILDLGDRSARAGRALKARYE